MRATSKTNSTAKQPLKVLPSAMLPDLRNTCVLLTELHSKNVFIFKSLIVLILNSVFVMLLSNFHNNEKHITLAAKY